MSSAAAPAPLEFTIYIIEDDAAVREALSELFRAADIPTRSYEDSRAFLDELPNLDLSQSCVLSDVRMPGADGLQLLKAVHAADPATPVVLMTGANDVGLAVRAMKAGAADLIEKPFSSEHLVATVQDAVRRRRLYASEAIDAYGILIADAADRLSMLSPREREILEGLAAGKPNKIIAHELGLSARTVEIHRARMMERLSVRSLSEALRLAVLAELAAVSAESDSL